jgi:hypothetical protein
MMKNKFLIIPLIICIIVAGLFAVIKKQEIQEKTLEELSLEELYNLAETNLKENRLTEAEKIFYFIISNYPKFGVSAKECSLQVCNRNEQIVFDSFHKFDEIFHKLNETKRKEILELFPKGNEKIKYRGFVWSPRFFESLLTAKLAGANIVEIKIDYLVTPDYNFVPAGDDCKPIELKKQREGMRKIINQAHNYNLTVHLLPFMRLADWAFNIREPPFERVPKEKRQIFLERLTNLSLDLAKFAQENNVEIFTPMVEVHQWVGWKRSSQWHQEILPKIRKIYKGELMVTYQNFLDLIGRELQGKEISEDEKYWKDFNYGGYDFVGPNMNANHVNDWETLETVVRKTMDFSEEVAEKYNVSIIYVEIFTEIEVDDLYTSYKGKEEEGKIRYIKLILDEFMKRNPEKRGILFYEWGFGREYRIYSKKDEEGIYRPFMKFQTEKPYNLIKEYFVG